MQTTWPTYDGSVRISWYPVIEVLKTTSPDASPVAPSEVPSKVVPSASARMAFFIDPPCPPRGRSCRPRSCEYNAR